MVITKVPGRLEYGNLCNTLEVYLDPQAKDGEYNDDALDICESLGLPPQLKMFFKVPVFHVGEILITDGERELGYPGRKPSKWSVSYETFDNVEKAIERSMEVMNT
jgi:hypothetical protein